MKQSLVVACLVLASGCAGVQSRGAAQVSEGGHLLAGPFAPDAWVEGQRVTGSGASLALGERALTGQFRSRTVNLDWTDQHLIGVVGERRVRLELAEGDDVFLQGQFAGLPTQLTLDQKGLRGRVGVCEYDLKRAKGGFVGVRNCGAGAVATEVAFPSDLEQRAVGARAALLGLLLASDGTRINMVAGSGPPTTESRGNARRHQQM